MSKSAGTQKERTPQKSASAIDTQVGQRVRLRRMLIGMSQQRFGELLGLTFQQVQKYERGVNRIGAGRLFDMAMILGVAIDYFYEGASVGDEPHRYEPTPPIMEFISGSEGLQLIVAFMKIKNRKQRKRVLDLVKQMAGD